MSHCDGVLMRYRLLEGALNGKENIPLDVLKACRSQGSLAALDLNDKIRPMSLNTLKFYAESLPEIGSWTKMNEMRLTCAKLYDAKKKDGRRLNAKKETGEKIITLKTDLEAERRYRIRLEAAYQVLLKELRMLAINDKSLKESLDRHVAGFSFKRLSIMQDD